MRLLFLRQHRRIVIPADVVRDLKLDVGDAIYMEISGDTILLTPRRAVTGRLHEAFADVPHSLADRLIARRQVQ